MAIGAAALFASVPQAKSATLNYTFAGELPPPNDPVDPKNYQGWTSVLGAPWQKYNGVWTGFVDDGHLGHGWSPAAAQLARSPEFRLDGSGPLTCQMVGDPASPAPTPVSAAGVPTIHSAEISSVAIDSAGFMGVALRDVTNDTYVLSKAHTGTNFSANPVVFSDLVFSQAELAPFANNRKIYTVDFIDNTNSPTGGGNWAILGGAQIPGHPVTVEKTYDFNDGSLQGWNNRVWNAATGAWVDLAPDVETMPSTVNGGVIQPPSADNNLFANNGTKIEPVGGNIDTRLNTLWLRSPVFTLAPFKAITAEIAGTETNGTSPTNDTSVSFTADSEGWRGIALRRVSDGQFVLWKPTTLSNGDILTVTFSQAELAPYVGFAFTLDLINANRDAPGGLNMDNVSIPTAASSACDIVSFGTDGVINGTNISLTVPFGTNLATLAPTCKVSPDATFTGPTPNFSLANPSNYEVVAQDGTKKTYSVTIGFGAPSPACDILTFKFPGQFDTVISGLNISLTVPTNTNITALRPTYTASAFAVGTPASGTAKDFTNPQSYTIVPQNGGASKTYTVTVTKAAIPSVFSWNSAVAGNWSDAPKWTNDLASATRPVDGGVGFYTLNFNQAGTYTVTNDLSGSFALNQLNFASATTLAGAGSLAFTKNGVVQPTLNQNSANPAIIESPVILTTGTTVSTSFNSKVTLDGLISGAGSLTKSGPGVLVLNGFEPGTGTAFAPVPNTYSGGTTVSTGILQLGSLVGTVTPLSVNPAGTGTILLSAGGSIQFNSVRMSNAFNIKGGSLNNLNGWGVVTTGPISLNVTLPIVTDGNFDAQGIISGGGGITKSGGAILFLSGTNTYIGDTTVNGGTLAVKGTSIKDTNKLIINGGKVSATGTEDVNSLFFGAVQQASGTWGATGSGATSIDDARFSGADGVVNVLSGTAPVSDFASWMSAYSTITLAADKLPTADPDGDGMTNQQEYAFGLNPTSPVSSNPIAALLDQTTGKFSYTRRATPATTGLIYTILTSPDLVTWTADASATQVAVANGNVETVVVTLSTPAVAGKLFVKVKAATP